MDYASTHCFVFNTVPTLRQKWHCPCMLTHPLQIRQRPPHDFSGNHPWSYQQRRVRLGRNLLVQAAKHGEQSSCAIINSCCSRHDGSACMYTAIVETAATPPTTPITSIRMMPTSHTWLLTYVCVLVSFTSPLLLTHFNVFPLTSRVDRPEGVQE